jgi:hypothetical protein
MNFVFRNDYIAPTVSILRSQGHARRPTRAPSATARAGAAARPPSAAARVLCRSQARGRAPGKKMQSRSGNFRRRGGPRRAERHRIAPAAPADRLSPVRACTFSEGRFRFGAEGRETGASGCRWARKKGPFRAIVRFRRLGRRSQATEQSSRIAPRLPAAPHDRIGVCRRRDRRQPKPGGGGTGGRRATAHGEAGAAARAGCDRGAGFVCGRRRRRARAPGRA